MTNTLPPVLRKNLAALQKRDLSLFERICLPVGSDHIQKTPEGDNLYLVHRSWHCYDLSDEQVAVGLQELSDEHVFLFGLGAGEQLMALLRSDAASILAWDRDPWILRLLLGSHDISRDLASGRLRLALGTDLLDALEDSVPRGALIHPFFADQYRLEYQLIQTEIRPKRALICAGTLFVDDLADALSDAGYSCFTWDTERLSTQELSLTAKRFGAELVAGINYSHGLAEACRDLNLELVIWEIDPATDPPKAVHPPATHAQIFSYRRAQIPVFEAANFPNTSYLPLAANPRRRFPVLLEGEEKANYSAPVAFVGASMRAQAHAFRNQLLAEYCLWRGGSPNEAQAECSLYLEALTNAHRDDLTRCHVPMLLEEAMPQFLAAMRSNPNKPDPVVLVSEIVAADKRMVYLANLGQLGVHMWGDEAWQDLEEHGGLYRGSAGHRFELNKVYSGATVNVDIGRIYQNDIVTMRVFDVMACGGFVLTERNDALLELFTEGVEVECYTSLEELVEKAAYFIEHPEEAAAIAARGLLAVTEQHNIDDRVARILQTLD